MMKANRLNVFYSGADSYSRIGLLPRLTALQVKVVVPARGATIKGVALLGASAADLSGVTKVDYYVKSDDGGHEELIGAGRDSAIRLDRLLQYHDVPQWQLRNSGA